MDSSISNSIFDKFFQYSSDLLCITNKEGIFIKLNPMWEKILGYKTSELEGKPYLKFVHTDDIKKTKKAIQELEQSREIVDFAIRYRYKDGSYHWLQWHSSSDGDNIFSLIQDITEIEKTEAGTGQKEVLYELRQSEAILRSTMESISDGLLVVNSERKVTHYNSKFRELFSVPQKVLNLHDDKDLLEYAKNKLKNPDKYQKKIEEIYQGKDSTKFVVELKNGKIIEFRSYPLVDENHVCGRVWVFSDITEQINNEEAIRLSEKKYRLLFENMTNSFALHKIIYDNKGKVIDYSFEEVNPVFEKYVNMPAISIIGKKAKELFPNTEDHWTQLFGKVARTGKPEETIMYSKEFDKYFEAFVFYTEKDHCAAIFNDVTDRVINGEILRKFKASIDYSLDGVYWINNEAGFDYVNEQACKMLGYTHDELIQLKVSDIDPNSNYEEFYKIWDRLHNNKQFETYSIESIHKRKDGSTFPIELNTIFIWNDNKGLLIAYAKDISERKKYEASILNNQKLLNESQRIAQMGSWELNLEDNSISWSDSTYMLYGLDKNKDKISHELFLQLVHPDDREHIIRQINNTINAGKIENDEFRIIRPDGQIRDIVTTAEVIKIDNKPMKIIGVVKDITEIKKADKALKVSEQKMQSLFKIVPAGIGVVNEGFITEANPELCKITGYSKEELIGKNTQDLYPSEDEYLRVEDILYNQFDKKSTQKIETIWKRKDGLLINLYIALTQIDPGFMEKEVTFTVLDITDRKKAEENLIETQERLQTFMDSATDSFSIWDKDLRLIDLNKVAISRHPIFEKKEDFIGLKLEDLIIDKSEDMPKYKSVMETGKPYIGEEKIIIDNKEIWMTVSIFKVKDGLGIVASDITKRKDAELKLREKDIKLKSIFQVAPVGIGLITDGNFVECNDSFFKITGYSEKEIIGESARILVTKEEDYIHIENGIIRRFKEGKHEFTVETTWKKKDTVIINVLLRFVSLDKFDFSKGTTFSVLDITERKQHEEALIKNQKLLLESQRIAKMGSWELDLKTNKLFWNKEAFNVYGCDYLSVEPTLELFYDLLHHEDRESVENHLKNITRKGNVDDIECRIIIPDGSLKYIIISLEIIFNVNKEPTHLYGTVQDITQQKNYEGQIIKEKERAEESEQRFIALHNASFGGIAIHDKGIILDCNRGLTEITGYSYEELIGMDGLLLIAEEYRGLVMSNIMTKKEEPYETVGLRKNGDKYPIRLDARNIPYRGKPARSVEFRDITKEKEIEKQIIAAKERAEVSEQKFQRIFEFAPVSIGLLNNRVILDVNSQVCNITWYNKEDLIGKKTEVVFPSRKEYEKVGKVMYQQLAENGFSEFESNWKRKDGKSINVYLALTYLDPEEPSKGVLFTALDITKLKETENQLIKAKERAEESEFFLKESQRTGNIGSFKLFFNKDYWISTETLKNILGIDDSYDKSTAGWFNIVHPDDRKMMNNYFQNEVIGKLQPFNKEYRIIRKTDNEIRWLHGVGKLYFDNNRNLIHMLGTIQDITERKLLEEERQMMNVELEKRVKERTVQLQQANKDLESFAYSVSHDLRAPIRHIDGFMHLLEKTISPVDTKSQNYIDKISKSSKNMSAMIDGLLQFSRLGRADLKTIRVNLSYIIEEIITLLKPDYEGRNIQWEIGNLPFVNGDPELLKIAFENLISNAIKYTSKKEKTIIEISEKGSSSEKVCILIKDNGVGFDMAYKDKLFGVFQRLHKNEEFEGTGIGLANVKQIIEKHNGSIDVESEVNKGTSFYITLPKQK